RLLRVDVEAGALERYTTGVVAFFFALGWLAARATTVGRRCLVSLLAVVLTAGFFDDPVREGVVVAGVMALTWLPHVRVPRWCARGLGRGAGLLATHSLFVYLTHWQVYPPLEDAGHPWLALLASFAVGIGYGVVMRPAQRWVASRVSSVSHALAPTSPGTWDSPHESAGDQYPNPRPSAPDNAHTIDNWRAPRASTGR